MEAIRVRDGNSYQSDQGESISHDDRIETLSVRVSPPPVKGRKSKNSNIANRLKLHGKSELAAIEAGQKQIQDHLQYFSEKLSGFVRADAQPRMSVADFRVLYQRNQKPTGCHFVVHQHDHPIAGTHYDLRLQINETSSASWACMYGLPGNPDSFRINRNATETRVHCLWNHLIETASYATGSMLIWDTGEYEVLPYHPLQTVEETDRESLAASSEDEDVSGYDTLSEPEKLNTAFKAGKIRLRLHGSRLPKGYTITLRLSSSNEPNKQPKKPIRKRRRKDPKVTASKQQILDSDEEAESLVEGSETGHGHSDEDGDEAIRLANAYPGANNTIGSIHQRTWFLSFSRESSGFVKRKGAVGWTARGGDAEAPGFEPFIVKGRDFERSVLTDRLAKDVLDDEGVQDYVGRAGWKGVLQ